MRTIFMIGILILTGAVVSCPFPNGKTIGRPADESSLAPSPPGDPRVGNLPGGSAAPFLQVFEDANYQGASLLFSDPGVQSLTRYYLRRRLIVNAVTWNDQISSIKLYNGGVAILCEHKDMGGRWELITENVPNLKSRGFNDLASSIVVSSVQNFTNDGPTAIVFDNAGYSGYWDEIDVGENKPVLPTPGYTPNYYPNMDRSISSVRCYTGSRLVVYDGQNYTGRYLSTADNLTDLADYGFSNSARSIQVVNDVYPSHSVPFYRYYSKDGKDHFYTANWYELEWGNGAWEHKGIECYILPYQIAGTIPLYEYWYSGNGTCDHLLVTDPVLAANSPWGYSGVRGYVYKDCVAGTVPLFGFWNAADCDHAIATNPDAYKQIDGWSVFGVLGYVYPSTYSGYRR